MGLKQSRLQYLFEKYFQKTASLEERNELANLVNDKANKKIIIQLFNDAWEKYEGDGEILNAEKSNEILQHILGKGKRSLNDVVRLPGRKFKWWRSVAAAILVFVAGVYWFSMDKKVSQQKNAATVPASVVKPGSFKARLTLSDGSTIILDSVGDGQVAQQGSTRVINMSNQLIYKLKGVRETADAIQYNTITTANSETYSFTMADGTKVWLNAASSIHFPVAFRGEDRRIQITGEVYLEVAKNTQQPFIASANGMDVLALGTQFNINAYNDEGSTSATLIEGKVKVTKGMSNTILKPGQQTKLNNNGELSEPNEVNIDEVIGWKEGLFHFENADLKTILRQFSRWYDIEIVYEGDIKNRKFFGIVNRSSPLSEVLKMLTDNNIVFRIEGKRLIVKTE